MLHCKKDIGRVEGSRSTGERGTAQARPATFEQTGISVLAAVGSLRVIAATGDSVRQRDATADAAGHMSFKCTALAPKRRGRVTTPRPRRPLDDISAELLEVRRATR